MKYKRTEAGDEQAQGKGKRTVGCLVGLNLSGGCKGQKYTIPL